MEVCIFYNHLQCLILEASGLPYYSKVCNTLSLNSKWLCLMLTKISWKINNRFKSIILCCWPYYNIDFFIRVFWSCMYAECTASPIILMKLRPDVYSWIYSIWISNFCLRIQALLWIVVLQQPVKKHNLCSWCLC